jgi:hypothetical protein
LASEEYANVQKGHEYFSLWGLAIDNSIKPSQNAPERIRTTNLLIRSQMLYPVELRAPPTARSAYYIRFEPTSNAAKHVRSVQLFANRCRRGCEGARQIELRRAKSSATLAKRFLFLEFATVCFKFLSPASLKTHGSFYEGGCE